MAGYDGGGSIGGKFRKRPFRRGPATPYDRQPARPAHTHLAEPQGKRWLSKLVDPATRIIAWSASRFLSSSIFQKRLGASPDAAPEANQKSMEEVLKEPCSTSLLEVQEQHTVNSSNASSAQQHGASVGVDEVFEIEQKLKLKVFTRKVSAFGTIICLFLLWWKYIFISF
ncbi:nuclear pore complex protein [Canna indica]|uniref:Nuclear pore complex protein n=1 Tax=Canna indica TaxID=4628 RepID=A0AAQ3K718_9LILI|nr:nuclear pore complex protein [Canna indica]